MENKIKMLILACIFGCFVGRGVLSPTNICIQGYFGCSPRGQVIHDSLFHNKSQITRPLYLVILDKLFLCVYAFYFIFDLRRGEDTPTYDYFPVYNCLGLAIFEVSSFLNSIHWVIHPTVRPMTKIGVNIDFGICNAVNMMPV